MELTASTRTPELASFFNASMSAGTMSGNVLASYSRSSSAASSRLRSSGSGLQSLDDDRHSFGRIGLVFLFKQAQRACMDR